MSKIAVRMGHLNCGVDGAAVGIINEYDVIRAYAPYVISALQRAGVEVIDVTPTEENIDYSNTVASPLSQSLGYGCDRANEANADLFISLHANCFNADAEGCTGYCNSDNANGVNLMNSILAELTNIGFASRGYMNGYSGSEAKYEIKYTNMTAVIVEPFFITNQYDVDLYNRVGPQALGEAIAKGILNYLGMEYVPCSETVVDSEPVVNGTVIFSQVYAGNLEVIFKNPNGDDYIGTVKLDNIVKKG